MSRPQQTYATHRQSARLWLVAALTSLLGFVAIVVATFQQPGLLTVGLLLMSFALMCAVLMARGYALRNQDRIIRLEMQIRLARLGLAPEYDRLSLRQLVALRFASDAELPPLLQRAVAENLSPDQIKRAVTNWQGDYHRV